MLLLRKPAKLGLGDVPGVKTQYFVADVRGQPSLLIGNGQLLKDAEKATQFPQKMYLAIGTAEGSDNKASERDADAVREMEKILRAKELGPNRLKVVVEEGARRDETAWSKRLPNALVFLYGSDIHLLP